MDINFNIIKFNDDTKVKVLDLLWLLIIPIINVNYVIAGNTAKIGHDLTIELDNLIEFNSIFIIPYIYWYLYVVIGFVFILIKSRECYMRVVISYFIGMSICYLVYYIYPTQMQRPVVENTNICNMLVNFIYSLDKPFNCFPSLHVLTTYFIMRYTKHQNSKKIFYYTQISGILIILSTVFIKQHFVVDILGTIILCEIVIYLVKKISNRKVNAMLLVPYLIKNKIINRLKEKMKTKSIDNNKNEEKSQDRKISF